MLNCGAQGLPAVFARSASMLSAGFAAGLVACVRCTGMRALRRFGARDIFDDFSILLKLFIPRSATAGLACIAYAPVPYHVTVRRPVLLKACPIRRPPPAPRPPPQVELAIPHAPATALFHDLRALHGLAKELGPGDATGEAALYTANKVGARGGAKRGEGGGVEIAGGSGRLQLAARHAMPGCRRAWCNVACPHLPGHGC